MEEAHNYAPANADAVTEILKTVLSEGRKFGVSINPITQRAPGELDGDVLSQCMTRHRLTHHQPD